MEPISLLFGGLIKLVGSAGFGTIFGGVMGYFNRKADLELRKLEYDDKQKERGYMLAVKDKDAMIMDREWRGRMQVAEIEGATAIEQSAYSALGESYKFAVPEKGTRMAAFSSFVRPFLSLGYFVVSSVGTGYILYYAFWVYKITLSQETMTELLMFVIQWFAFMAAATIGWWFAMRPGSAMPTMKR